jgi:Fe-S oxidoreductase
MKRAGIMLLQLLVTATGLWYVFHEPQRRAQIVDALRHALASYNLTTFHPETAIAAVEVLEDAGFQAVIPDVDLCCGRPLYGYGMLDTAKRWLLQILAVLHNEIEAGTQ